MLNQVVLVGRLTQNPECSTSDNGKKRTTISLAVSRSFKNSEGEYDTDFINCVLWNGIAENTCEYCKKGDIVGIKGRLQSSSYEKDGVNKYVTEVIVEKVTFLTSNSKKKEE